MTDQVITEASNQAASGAAPALDEIATKAIKSNKLEAIAVSQADLIRIGLTINEIQQRSFNLGVRVGIELASKMARGES